MEILKSSSEVRRENALRVRSSTCPECGHNDPLNAMTHVEVKHGSGFFKKSPNMSRKVHICASCGCQWAEDWSVE